MAAPTFVNVGTPTGGAGTVVMPLPASILADDILLLFIETENEAASISNQNGGTWAEVTLVSPQGTGVAAGPGSTRLSLFWSRYNGTQGNPTVGDSGNHQRGAILAFRGCVTTGDPWDVGAGNVASSASTSVTVPGATTSVADCMVVFGVANTTDTNTAQLSGGTWTNGNLSSIVNRVNVNSTTGAGGGLAVGHGVKTTAGGYGNTTGTLVTSSVQGRISIALKPAATAYSLTADAGSYAATGTTAALLVGYVLAAASGSYAVTGTDAGTFAGRAVVAASGSYAVTGSEATLTYTPANNHLLVADPGSYSIAGTDAGVLLGRTITAETAAYALTGSDAGLRSTRLLDAASGSYALSGTNAGLFAGRYLSAAAGSYVVTGQDAQLVYEPATGYVLGAAGGSYAITGTAASLLRGYVVAPDGGVYLVTGQDATLTRASFARAEVRDVRTVSLQRVDARTVALHRYSSIGEGPDGQSITRTYTWASGDLTLSEDLHDFSHHTGMGE